MSIPKAPEAYFETLQAVYGKACASAGGSVEKHYLVASQRLCVRFAGPALLLPLASALAHLEVEPSVSPDLTVLAWDSETTRTSAPRPGWKIEGHGARGEIDGFCDGRFHTIYELFASTLTMIDVEHGTAFWWTRSAADLPLGERGAPFRALLQFWLARHGLLLLHSAAVGLDGCGALLAGAGGAGKSSTALACLEAGFQYLADDYSLAGSAAPPTVYSLYNSAKLYPEDRAHYSLVAERQPWHQDATADKALLFLQQVLPEKIALGLPLAAVLLPEVFDGNDTDLEPIAGQVAMRALLKGAMPFPPSAAGEILAHLAVLARELPCYRLRLGRDRAQIPKAIAELLSARRATASALLS